MAFKYRKRDPASVEERMNQSAYDNTGYIVDGIKLYKVRDGENHIRILPATWDDGEGGPPKHYGYDVYVHYGIGPDNMHVICPHKQFDAECPICEAKARADRSGDEDTAKELRWNKRVLFWIIDRKDEDKGPQLWAAPYTLDQNIAKVSKDKRTGTLYLIEDPDEGFDVFFDKEGEGQKTKYRGEAIDRNPSPLGTARQMKEWLDYIGNNEIPGLLIVKEYDELKKIFQGGAPEEERPRRREPEPESERPRPRVRQAEAEPEPERTSSRPRLNRPRDDVDNDEIPEERPRPRARDPEPEPEPEKAELSPAQQRAAALRAKYGKK